MVVVLKKLGGKQRAQGIWLWSLFIIIHWRSLEEWYVIKTICSPESLSSYMTEFRANGPAIGPLVAGEVILQQQMIMTVCHVGQGGHTEEVAYSQRAQELSKSRGQAGRVGKRLCGPYQLEKE